MAWIKDLGNVKGDIGPAGPPGPEGVGIDKIELLMINQQTNTRVYRIYYTDYDINNHYDDFEIPNIINENDINYFIENITMEGDSNGILIIKKVN